MIGRPCPLFCPAASSVDYPAHAASCGGKGRSFRFHTVNAGDDDGELPSNQGTESLGSGVTESGTPRRPGYLHDPSSGDVVRVGQGGPLTIERVERLSSVQVTVIAHRRQAWPL